jgi:hypothetical protein
VQFLLSTSADTTDIQQLAVQGGQMPAQVAQQARLADCQGDKYGNLFASR